MKFEVINIEEKMKKVQDYWAPKVIEQMNDNQFKLAKFKGDFTWHCHKETDEVFYVLEGVLDLEFRDGKVVLKAGEMFVVPKGLEHKPFAKEECKVMIIEPEGVVNTGEVQSSLTASNDNWI